MRVICMVFSRDSGSEKRYNAFLQFLGKCTTSSDCTEGQWCSSCPIAAKFFARCTRLTPFYMASMDTRVPFNRYAWLTTHNSFSIAGIPSESGAPTVAPTNQEDTVTNQLMNGVRGLMLDMYDFRDDVWLCHSFDRKCFNNTAFRPAIKTLQEIEAFLSKYTNEIVAIFIEDYVYAPNGLTNLFTKAGLMKYWFPLSAMPKDGQDWPLLSDMIANNHRLLVFTSIREKESTEGIAYEWNYIVENQYGDGGMKTDECPNRAESWAMNDKSRSLVLMNFFPTTPLIHLTCKYNSDMLSRMLRTCQTAAGGRWPNFLAVDFYMRSTGSGAADAVDTLNGKHSCGCDDIRACQAGSTARIC